jgi:hypothetical protein
VPFACHSERFTGRHSGHCWQGHDVARAAFRDVRGLIRGWQVLDSNQRRLSPTVYRSLPYPGVVNGPDCGRAAERDTGFSARRSAMTDSQPSNERFTDEEAAFLRHVPFGELSARIRPEEMVEGVATESGQLVAAAR